MKNLDNIGKRIKEAREEQGLTIEEAAKLTKLQVPFLRAIESGDVGFFKDNLSYLSYYVRYYANAVNIDPSEFKDDLERLVFETTQNIEIDEIRKKVELNENIKKRYGGKSDSKQIKSKLKKRRKQIDFSFVTFVIASVALIGLLLFVGIKYVPNWFNQEPVDRPPVVIPGGNEPSDPDDKKDDEEEPPEDEVNHEIVFIEPNVIEVHGLKENDPVEIEVRFVSPQTWIAVNVNGQQVAEPVSKTYAKDEVIVLKETMEKDKEIFFQMGIMLGNEFYLNGERIEFEEAIQNSNNVVRIHFKLIEDGAN